MTQNKFFNHDKFKILSHNFWNSPMKVDDRYFIGEVLRSEPNRAGQIYVSIGLSPQYVYERHCIKISEEDYREEIEKRTTVIIKKD